MCQLIGAAGMIIRWTNTLQGSQYNKDEWMMQQNTSRQTDKVDLMESLMAI